MEFQKFNKHLYRGRDYKILCPNWTYLFTFICNKTFKCSFFLNLAHMKAFLYEKPFGTDKTYHIHVSAIVNVNSQWKTSVYISKHSRLLPTTCRTSTLPQSIFKHRLMPLQCAVNSIINISLPKSYKTVPLIWKGRFQQCNNKKKPLSNMRVFFKKENSYFDVA